NLCAIGDMDGHGVAPAFVRTLRLADIRAMSTASPGADGVAAVVPALAKFGTNWPNPVPNATLRMMAAMKVILVVMVLSLSFVSDIAHRMAASMPSSLRG